MLRGMYLGLYYAPGVVCEALKTSVYAACLFELLGYAATPAYGAQRNDIITSVETGSPEGMVALCGGVQAGSPVDSFAAPEPGDMPGYEDPVIMAAWAHLPWAAASSFPPTARCARRIPCICRAA